VAVDAQRSAGSAHWCRWPSCPCAICASAASFGFDSLIELVF
jgi:hypothetical protein